MPQINRSSPTRTSADADWLAEPDHPPVTLSEEPLCAVAPFIEPTSEVDQTSDKTNVVTQVNASGPEQKMWVKDLVDAHARVDELDEQIAAEEQRHRALIAEAEREAADCVKRVQEEQHRGWRLMRVANRLKEFLAVTHSAIGVISTAISGIAAHGFMGYLSRTNASAQLPQQLIRSINTQAQRQGDRGRKKENKETQRRPAKAKQRKKKPVAPVARTSLPIIKRRSHEERIRKIKDKERAREEWRLLRESRRLDHAAILTEVELLKKATSSHRAFSIAPLSIECGHGSRLIFIQGLESDVVLEAAQTNHFHETLAAWLSLPYLLRLDQVGPRNRLKEDGLHMAISLAPEEIELALNGALDQSLATEAVAISARLDLREHRLVAFLHTDSKGRNPHLHVVASRISDKDLSLWSMPGCMRATTLWMHARVNTVMTFNEAMLKNDIDVLGGRSAASQAGADAMRTQKLIAKRRYTDGDVEEIPMQGEEACERMKTVAFQDLRGGGMFLYGLRRDLAKFRQNDNQHFSTVSGGLKFLIYLLRGMS